MRAVIDKAEGYLCGVLLTAVVTLLFFQVIMRVGFNTGIAWVEELARYAFVWFVFLGAARAARLGAHNRVSMHLRLLPPKVADYLLLVADLIWVAFNLAMIWKAYEVISLMLRFPYTSPALGWSMAYVYLIIPIGFGLMTIRALQVRYLKIVRGVEPDDVDQREIEEAKRAVSAEHEPKG